MKQVTSATMSMSFAIRPHLHECRTSPCRGHFRENHQLAHTESFDKRWSSEIGEVFLRVIRQTQQTEHLRHPRFTKSFLLTDLGLCQLFFVRQALLPAKHLKNGMGHGRTFGRLVPVLASIRTRRPPSELEGCSDKRGQIVLCKGQPQNQFYTEAGS